jgi:hypothetical protein
VHVSPFFNIVPPVRFEASPLILAYGQGTFRGCTTGGSSISDVSRAGLSVHGICVGCAGQERRNGRGILQKRTICRSESFCRDHIRKCHIGISNFLVSAYNRTDISGLDHVWTGCQNSSGIRMCVSLLSKLTARSQKCISLGIIQISRRMPTAHLGEHIQFGRVPERYIRKTSSNTRWRLRCCTSFEFTLLTQGTTINLG